MPQHVVIHSLHVYPLKGCRGIDVDALELRDGLIDNDRSWMIVSAATGEFVSQRHLPAMARLRVDRAATQLEFDGQTLQLPAQTGPPWRVDVWGDQFDALDGGDAAAHILSRWFDQDVRLVRLPTVSPRSVDPFWTGGDDRRTSFADLAPILLTNNASLDELNRRRGKAGLAAIPMARFRPNVVIDGLPAFAEDHAGALQHERYTLTLIKPCARCNVTELDPQTGQPMDDAVLRSLASFRTLANARGTRGIMFGQNATVQHGLGAVMRVGDLLRIAGPE